MGTAQQQIQSIEDTIDYAILLEIVKKEFAIPTPLIETLAEKIEQSTRNFFPQIKYFYISIQKKNVSLSAQLESSEVILEKSY